MENHKWGNVIHDQTVLWVASWKDNITNKTKYVRFGDKSDFKAESDIKKFDKARKLKTRPDATNRDKQLANWFINMQTNRPKSPLKKDPLVGTGKKPKGSGRRLYTDENPKDTVSIKFATVADARKTIAKLGKLLRRTKQKDMPGFMAVVNQAYRKNRS